MVGVLITSGRNEGWFRLRCGYVGGECASGGSDGSICGSGGSICGSWKSMWYVVV